MSQASLSNLCHPDRSEAPAERTKDPNTANGIPKAVSLSTTDPKKHDSRRMNHTAVTTGISKRWRLGCVQQSSHAL